MKCNYCNENEGIYTLKSKKLCCMPTYQSCPETKRKNKEGINRHYPAAELFISRSKEKFPDRINYDKTVYVDSASKVILTCKKHNVDFEQVANDHLNRTETFMCPSCIEENSQISLNEMQDDFINVSKELFPNKFTYERIKYINRHTKVILTCVAHNKDFEQFPTNHMQNHIGCPDCLYHSLSYLVTKDEFLHRLTPEHHEIFDYSYINYVNYTTPIKIWSKEHNMFFEQLPWSHIKRKFLFKNDIDLNFKKFILKAINKHGDFYNYDNSIYKGMKTLINIECPIHGEFWQMPKSHVHHGCQSCALETTTNISIAETERLNSLNIDPIYRSIHFKINGKKYVHDAYVPETNTIYEFWGDYWHGNPLRYEYDYWNKKAECYMGQLYQKTLDKINNIKSAGYKLIEIWETDWLKQNPNFYRKYNKRKLEELLANKKDLDNHI